jgi:hypothetical protein
MATKTVVREKIAPPQQTTVLEGVSAAPVELALIAYKDEYNRDVTQFAIVGKNTVHLLDGKALGVQANTQRSGRASAPLRDAVFKALGREVE